MATWTYLRITLDVAVSDEKLAKLLVSEKEFGSSEQLLRTNEGFRDQKIEVDEVRNITKMGESDY